MSQLDMSRYTLEDASRMMTIAAMEGNATAQRELAIMHLTQPSLVPIRPLPLSHPSDVFRREIYYSASHEDRDKMDPSRLCVAMHLFPPLLSQFSFLAPGDDERSRDDRGLHL